MSVEVTDRIDQLADLLLLTARALRWLAQLRHGPADAARLRAIARDIDQIAGRLRRDGRQDSSRSDASEARLH